MAGFDAALIKRYDVPGPRYTSYPTALQFDAFTINDFDEAIQTSPFRDRDLSLYVHIPFCATLCYYCACNKIVTRKREPAVEYLGLLAHEAALLAPRFTNRKVSQLHWGGGTPTFLDDEQIEKLNKLLRSAFEFRSDEEGEFSIEIDPRTVDAKRIEFLRQQGFNRLSFGVQDFDPHVQQAVNRKQSFEETRAVIEAARNFGFGSVSIDLIYGLPHQNESSFARTLDLVAALRPDRVSIYNYAHLPDRFSPQKRILASDLPDPDEKLNILELCIESLTSEGYVYIGMDHFALPDDELAVAQREGTLQRNFQGYSTFADCDLIGLGVTSISHIGNTYSQNEKELDQYRTSLEKGQLPVSKGVVIDDDDLIRKEIIKTLMCQFRLEFEDVNTRFGINFSSYFADELSQLFDMERDGLIDLGESCICVTDKGRFLIRNICMVFDRHLRRPEFTERYSKAI